MLVASGSRGNGRDCSRRVFEDLLSTTDAYLGLCALGTQGATDVGSYNIRLEEQQRTFTSGIGPLRKTRGELLPIPLELAKPFLQTPGTETRSDVRYPLALANPYLDSLGTIVTKKVEYEVVEGALGVLAALILWQYTNRYVHTYIPT